ncbi:MAG TPA: NHLP-related RiPP peptide [Arenimonas sp.]|nr:NHLP-related RiPP peptide [Arenimonas sp.]HPW33939.1 NHLP-related RiPP peptide [Arenimonas sp.]
MPFQLSEELVDKLLDKLSSDEDFRTSFQKSPRQALASLGHAPAAKASDSDKGAWACMSCNKLASAADIKKSRDALRTQLLSAKAQFNPVALEAAK